MSSTFTGYSRTGRMGFSGCDINAIIRLPQYMRGTQQLNEEKVFNIGTLQTISISTYNAKTPVKALGFKSPIAVARGGRTIAGTLIFNQMHLHVLNENAFATGYTTLNDKGGFLTYSSGDVDYVIPEKSEEINKEKLKKQWDFSWDTSLFGEVSKPSDLPPFDIIILFLNEDNDVGKIILYGVDIVHDSQTMSVEDIYTEVQYQYIARDIEYFHAVGLSDTRSWKSQQNAPKVASVASEDVAPAPSTTPAVASASVSPDQEIGN
jgi:hypothetical protein